MKTFRIGLLVLISFCLTGSSISAQEYTPQQQEIVNLLKEFEYAVDHFTGSSDISKLISFYSDNYSMERMEYSIDGTGKRVKLGFDEFKQNIMRAAENEDEEITYEISDINYVQVVGFGAVANFNANFSINEDGEKLFSGTRNTTLQMKKTPGGWKIVHSYVTEVRDDIVKYLCTYNLFQKTER
jgi:ketosteroid isomerase-like protein